MTDEEKNVGEEIEIDFSKVVEFIKKYKKYFVYILLAIILVMTFISRTQNVSHLEGKYLLSPDDPYVFLRYANDIANGNLPKNDTLRYYPQGFDITGENLGSAYLAGYMLNFVRLFNPSATMFDIAAYFAPVLLVIGIAAFFFLTREILEDDLASLTASGLLAFSIAIFFRTTAGFLEKEPLFLPLMILSFLFFLKAYKQKEFNKEFYIYSVLGGLFSGFAAATSGLFFFIEIYLAAFVTVEVFLQKMNKHKLVTYAIWFALMSAIILVTTTKYGTIGYFATMQGTVPLIGLVFALTAVFVKKPERISWMPKGLFHIFVGLGIILLIGGAISLVKPGFLTEKIDFIIQRVETPVGVNRFEQSVSENQPPVFLGGSNSWWATFGVSFINIFGGGTVSFGLIFLLFFFGGLIMFYNEFKNFKYVKWLTAIFTLFMCALIFEHFSGDPRYSWVNALFSQQWAYFALFGITIIIFMFLEHSKTEHLEKINSNYLLILTWFVIATIAANGAVRLFFMLAFPAMIMAAYFIKWSCQFISERFGDKYKYAPYAFAAIVILMMFSVVTISNANMYPGLEEYYNALNWVKENTPKDAVFTHWWDYGYIVQAIGERATVVDPGNFYVERDYDTGGYLFNAKNNSEALMYLNKYGRPSYWFIISEDVPKFYQIARLGSLSNLSGNLKEGQTLGREAYFGIYAVTSQNSIKPNNLGLYSEYPMMAIMEPLTGPSQVLKDFKVGNVLYPGEETYILRIIVPVDQNKTGPPLVQIYNSITKKMEIFKAQCECQKKVGCYDVNNTDNVTTVPTCVLLLEGGALNIPYKTRDVLFTQLYILEKEIPGYELVYNSSTPLDLLAMAGRTTNIKIYKFNYTAIEQNQGW